MSSEQAPRTFERPKLKKEPDSEILLAQGVPTPVTLAPSFENTQAFFSAISSPIDGKNPPKPFGYQKSRSQTSEQWVRNWEILGRYIGTDAALQEIGNRYGITRQGVHHIVKKLVDQSYATAPAALREAFTRESLATKKPDSLHKSMRHSEASGGKMREVREAALSGKSHKEIREETGASRWMLSRYRSKGIAVPYLKEAVGKKYQENLRFLANGLLDDRQILKIFEDIEKHNTASVCESLRKAGVLVPLTKAARDEGVFIHNSQYAKYRLLKELEIPALHVEYHHVISKSGERQTLNYFFVLNNHERTKEAFTNPSFDAFRTNPVEVLGRVPEEIPTTNIRKDPAYISAGKFLRERGIPIRPKQAREYLGPDCPVSVFYIPGKSGGSEVTLLARQDQDALAGYLGAKLAS